ncbi:MAG: D-glycero-beta-D-manno-heptose-7-phosphate kinase [Deltaproteobacteria bacterium]|nr:D-glycero-beta-D-manno-heptose-7-phosphate kinase [Deltaproteobacteria bacterium]
MPANFDISRFRGLRILVIGDLMVDEYLWGDVDRISPEAPVPVVSVKRESNRLGGAGNVIGNLSAMGALVYAAGIAGRDRWGDIMLESLAGLGADAGGIVRTDERPTIRKTRVIAADQQVLRIDREKTTPVPDFILPPIHEFIEKYIPQSDAVLISDYGKGLISDSLMETVTLLCKKHGKICIADPKGIDYSRYAGVDLITPNKKEAGLAAGVDITDEQALERAGKRLLDIVSTKAVLITCGKDGMVLMDDRMPPVRIKARARQVYDVSGAGDTVLAVMGLCAASGATFGDGARLANVAAGIVVGKIGAATVSLGELEEAMRLNGTNALP